MKLSGQSILVTGATGAIGRAICRALVEEGANVVIHYSRNRDAAEVLLTSLKGKGWCLHADLSDRAGPQTLWDQAVAATGRLAGLVNNAGIRSEVAIEALINLTKSIAQSHGHEGVTAVALAPGWVRTEMAEAYIAEHGEAAALAGIPIARMADPQEIGEITAFAFRPSQASLNGAVLDVNGGSYMR
jgi:NAD(P)-dependent dehydrogenase (short-subunit alcohol dehydrogenase family)